MTAHYAGRDNGHSYVGTQLDAYVPANVRPGDLLVVTFATYNSIAFGQNGDFTTPAGWVKVGTGPGPLYCAYKIATASDTPGTLHSFVVTGQGSQCYPIGTMVAYAGIDQTNPVLVPFAVSGGSGTAPSQTFTGPGIVHAFNAQSSASQTGPGPNGANAPATYRGTAGGVGGSANMGTGFATRAVTGTGSTTMATTFSMGTGGNAATGQIVFKAAQNASPAPRGARGLLWGGGTLAFNATEGPAATESAPNIGAQYNDTGMPPHDEGTLLIAHLLLDSAGAGATPAGWTELERRLLGTDLELILARIAQSATETLTAPNSGSSQGAVIAITNPPPISAIRLAANRDTPYANGQVAFPALTGVPADSVLVRFLGTFASFSGSTAILGALPTSTPVLPHGHNRGVNNVAGQVGPLRATTNFPGGNVPVDSTATTPYVGTSFDTYTLAIPPNNTAPNAPTNLTPAANSTGTYNNGFTASWTLSDPDAGDTQSAFSFRRKLGAGAYEYYNVTTASWQSTEVYNTSTTPAYTFPAGKWPGGSYVWSVSTRDAGGLTGPYAADQAINSNSAPNAPTLGAPADGAGLDTRVANTFSWTHSDPQGDAQTAYALRYTVSGTPYWWNGSIFVTTETFITSAAASVSIPANAFERGVRGVWSVATKDASLQGSYAPDRIFYTTPPTPTTLTPTTGATVTTDLPTLGLILVTGSGTGQSTQRAEFQIARDAAFTSNLRTILEPGGDARVSGATTEAVSGAAELFQGTWYIRARALNTSGGQYSDYTATNTFTVSHPPTAINLTPTGGAIRQFGTTGNMTTNWNFSDTSPTDVQTAFQATVERNSDGVVLYDTGKQAGAAQGYTFVIASQYKGVLLRWRVRLYDSDDVLGAYSAYQTFIIDDAPTVAITAPADASTIQSGQPTVSWTYAGTRAQANYRVVIRAGSTVVHDTGVVASAATSYTPSGTVLVNNTVYTVQVTVSDTGALSSTATNTFTTTFAIPTAGSFTVNAANFNDLGRVRITWTNGTRETEWTGWLVYRRRVGGVWGLVYENRLDLPNYTFDDYYPASGVAYEYAVVQEVVRFGATLEGNKVPQTTPVLYTQYYWLIHPDDAARVYRLDHVTSDSFTDEYQEETFNIIGRGRKKDYGTHLGVSGSISASIHESLNGRTAATQRGELETIKASREAYYLRSPFRDYWLISLGNVSTERMAGTGGIEHAKVSFTYEEVV